MRTLPLAIGILLVVATPLAALPVTVDHVTGVLDPGTDATPAHETGPQGSAAPATATPATKTTITKPVTANPLVRAPPAPPAQQEVDLGTGVQAPASGTSPNQALASRLASMPSLEGPAVRDAILAYWSQLGYNVPRSGAHFEPNDTLMAAYNVGDVTGDGYDDVAMEAHCTTYECQFRPTPPLTQIPPDLEGGGWCATPHQLYVRDGRDGRLLWDMDLGKEELNATNADDVQDYIFCPVHLVVGTFPYAPDATGLLVYSVAGVAGDLPPSSLGGVNYILFGNPVNLILQHEVYLIDPATGERIWTHREDGLVAMWDGCGISGYFLYRQCTPLGSSFPSCCGDRHNSKFVIAQNLLVNTIDIPRTSQGLAMTSPTMEDSIFLQGVSFDYFVVETMPPATGPGSTRSLRYYEQYLPDEWLARIDITTGQDIWRTQTFTPDAQASIVPHAIQALPLGPPFTFFTGYGYDAYTADPSDFMYQGVYRWDVEVATNHYWRPNPCCYDQTGDGVPDILYTTLEWDPILGLEGAQETVDSRLVLFDGATGELVWEKVIAEDAPRFSFQAWDTIDAYSARLEPAGDANGDGHDDIMVHQFFLLEDFVHTVTLRSGADGSTLWGITSGKHKLTVPLGDADGDGGSDVAVIDWFDWDYPLHRTYDVANVTAHPVVVRNGADGHTIWQTQTFNAPIDLYYILDGVKANGRLDLDKDGVADLVIDDPFFLPDLTAVHQLSFVSGATGRTLHELRAVGSMAFPSWAGDHNNDGTDDYILMSGDALDVWITAYDGASGKPQHSQRFLTPKVNDFTLAVPRTRVLALEGDGAAHPLVTFHFDLTRVRPGWIDHSIYPQVTAIHANGARGWWYPEQEDPFLYAPIKGPTPSVGILEKSIREQTEGGLMTYARTHDKVLTKMYAGPAAAFAAMFGLGFVLAGRRRRKSQEVAEW